MLTKYIIPANCKPLQIHVVFFLYSIRLDAKNLLFLKHLYKGILLNTNPRVMYVGMQDQYYTFTMFDIQGCYARDYILGKIKIADEDVRGDEIKKWADRFATVQTGHDEIEFQRDYIRDLLKVCPRLLKGLSAILALWLVKNYCTMKPNGYVLCMNQSESWWLNLQPTNLLN